MVELKEVNKHAAGLKINKKVEREDELQRKFSQLSEEDHVLKTYEANNKKVSFLLLFFVCVFLNEII